MGLAKGERRRRREDAAKLKENLFAVAKGTRRWEKLPGPHPALGERCYGTAGAVPRAVWGSAGGVLLGTWGGDTPLLPSPQPSGGKGAAPAQGTRGRPGCPHVPQQPPAPSKGMPGWHLGALWLCQPRGQPRPHCPSRPPGLRCQRASGLGGCVTPGRVAREGSAAAAEPSAPPVYK